MTELIMMSLTYFGKDADHHGLDFYDASRALIGFQRSLALTAHLILHDEIITQAPSLKGARIVVLPPEDGSWKTVALIVFGGLWYGGTVSKDTPIGNLISSAYDYVINETMGFHVDYTKTLGIQYEERKKSHPATKVLPQSRFDSLAEKCTPAIIDMHRPIVFSETADNAKIFRERNSSKLVIGHDLNKQTYDYINYNIEGKDELKFCGSVSGYNSNSFSGRIYIPEQGRLISFYLTENARTKDEVNKVTTSLYVNAQQDINHSEESNICFMARTVSSKSGRIKNYW